MHVHDLQAQRPQSNQPVARPFVVGEGGSQVDLSKNEEQSQPFVLKRE